MKTLQQFKDEISKCVLCGTCRSVCPVFGVANREPASARGKMALCDALLKGEIGVSDIFVKHMTECVQCLQCRKACPNDVNAPDIILAARAEIAKEKGLPFTKSLIFHNLLNSGKLMPAAMKLAQKLQGLLFKETPEGAGLHRRIPLPLIDNRRLVPPLADRSFLEKVAELDKIQDSKIKNQNPAPRVGFYVGCMINYMLPNIGEATLTAIQNAGASVIVPADQYCCGMPALGNGDVETAKSLALKNLEAFEQHDLDYITTACATCGDALKKRFKELLSDEGDEVQQRVNKFSAKVRDITELLVNDLKINIDAIRPSAGIVTYHDPCHLNRGQGIKDEPRELIEMSGLEFKEMKHPCRCCGLGGSFNITNYEMSMEINRKKAEDIKSTGADIVATACPGCIIQIKDGLHQLDSNAKVVHVVELIAERVAKGNAAH